jgi:Putative DNA-binding domain
MSHQLAAQQTALLSLLFKDAINSEALGARFITANGLKDFKNTASHTRGLRAYRANAQALSASALQASYPVLEQLIGAENFRLLAYDFWQAWPPERGDLAQWGGLLAVYLPQVPQLQMLLQEHPYLPDVAKVEWALHVAATAADGALNAASFQLLTAHEPAQLCLVLSPGCDLLCSAYPVVALMQLHDARASEKHAQARQAIADGLPQTALVWRQGLRPMIGLVDAASAALIEAVLQGQPLSAALDRAFALASDFDFSAWLATQVQSGLLLGARSEHQLVSSN